MKFILAALALLLAFPAYADYKPQGGWSIAITNGATDSVVLPSTLCTDCRQVMLTATIAAYVDFATTAVTPTGSGAATSSSFYLPANEPTIWDIRPGATISVIGDNAVSAGTLRITVLSE